MSLSMYWIIHLFTDYLSRPSLCKIGVILWALQKFHYCFSLFDWFFFYSLVSLSIHWIIHLVKIIGPGLRWVKLEAFCGRYRNFTTVFHYCLLVFLFFFICLFINLFESFIYLKIIFDFFVFCFVFTSLMSWCIHSFLAIRLGYWEILFL